MSMRQKVDTANFGSCLFVSMPYSCIWCLGGVGADADRATARLRAFWNGAWLQLLLELEGR